MQGYTRLPPHGNCMATGDHEMVDIQLMEEILRHLLAMKPYEKWNIIHNQLVQDSMNSIS